MAMPALEDNWASEQITLSRPIQLDVDELTLLPANHADAVDARGFEVYFDELLSAPTQLPRFEDLAKTRSENRGDLGMCVVLLGDPSRSEPLDVFPLDLGELLDVDGPELARPGTFTATPAGLRLDARGGIKNVFTRVETYQRGLVGRRLHHDPILGSFQAISLGEVIPFGSFAFIDHALIRVDPL